ncbi:cell division protein FtsA [bacterium]|nr:cell division protein FtsA [bacterium]
MAKCWSATVGDNRLVLAIDIGLSKIDAVIADVGNGSEITVRGSGRSYTTGIEKGKITSQSELVAAIDRALKRAERDIGIRPANAIVSVPNFDFQFGYCTGLMIPKTLGKRLTEEDRLAAVHKSKKSIVTQDNLILHAIPVEYRVDNRVVESPVGINGESLEVTTHYIQADSDNVHALLSVIQTLNLHVAGMVYSPIASAQIFLSEQERIEGALLIDIGAESTSISFYKRNILQSTGTIPIGGNTINRDLSQCLSISDPEAERVKVKYGSLDIQNIEYRDKFELNALGQGWIEIKRQYMCKIIYSRVEELLKLIVKKVGIRPEFPYDIVCCGATTRCAGFEAIAATLTGHIVRVGPPRADAAHHIHADYGTALGLISFGLKTGAIVPHETPLNWLERLNRKLSRWF